MALTLVAAVEVLNTDALLRRIGGDVEFLSELVEIFLDAASSAIPEMRRAIGSGDAAALARTAHRLKGTVGSLSAGTAFEAARELETIARAGDLARAPEACASLERELERLKAALAGLLKDSSSCRS